MTSGPGFNPLSQPNFMPIALPPGQSTPPQQPNPASGPATSPPPNPTETAMALSLAATGFKFAEGPTGQTQDQWIDAMRTSANPMARAQFDALTMLAGGRGDNVAIKQVLDRYYALFSAKTASDVAAADKGMINQIATALGGLDPINKLMDVAQPAIANMVRNTGIGQTEWGASLQKILDTPGTISSYRTGFNEGVMEGGKALVVDIATMAAKTAQYAADHSMAGAGGDAIRSLFGTLPAGLDAVTPSLARGLQTDKAIMDTGQKISAYLANRTPAQVGADVAGVIGKQWDSLKASHAEAVRQGPQVEARWWGKVTGRITFEVAGTFIPVAGQAGKANALAKGGGMIADGARTVDKLSDGARAIDKAVDGKRAELASGGLRTGDDFKAVKPTGTRIPEDAPFVRKLSDPDVPGAATAKRRDGIDGVDPTPRLADAPPPKAPDPADGAGVVAAATRVVYGRFGNNIVEWTIDAQGRLISAKAHLTEVFSGLKRSSAETKAQGEAAAKGIAGDQGGHAVPHRFLSDQGGVNLFPQNGVPDEVIKMIDGKPVVEHLKNFNGSAFKTLENELADWVEAGGKIDYEVKFSDFDPKFPDRPNTVSIEFTVRNNEGRVVHSDALDFDNSAGQVYQRTPKATIKSKMPN